MAKSEEALTFSQYRNNTNPCWWKDSCLRINVLHCVGLYFCVFYLGCVALLRDDSMRTLR